MQLVWSLCCIGLHLTPLHTVLPIPTSLTPCSYPIASILIGCSSLSAFGQGTTNPRARGEETFPHNQHLLQVPTERDLHPSCLVLDPTPTLVPSPRCSRHEHPSINCSAGASPCFPHPVDYEGPFFPSSGAWPAPAACFQDVNMAGNTYGNCGKDSQGRYVKCDKRWVKH